MSALLHLSRDFEPLARWGVPISLVACVWIAATVDPGVRSRTALTALSRVLAVTCTAYIALQRPVFPIIDRSGWFSESAFELLWLTGILLSLLAWWRPILLIGSAIYLTGSKALAGHASGFPYEALLDIQPLQQIALATGCVALLSAWSGRPRKTTACRGSRSSTSIDDERIRNGLLFVIISFHTASYLFSGFAKAGLDGGPLSWLLSNRLENIYYAGVLNLHLFWQDVPGAIDAVGASLDRFERPMAAIVLGSQMVAFTLFANRRWALALLLLYDAMHLGVFLLQGANFLSWALVNVAVLAAIARLPDRFFGPLPVLISTLLMAFCVLGFGKFYRVAQLGWYDSRALNTAHFEAVADDGTRHRVPNAMFGLYSYPLSHMSFGFPPEGDYLPTSTNGGTDSWRTLQQADACRFERHERVSPFEDRWDEAGFVAFIQHLHERLVDASPGPLPWRANLYWHHFWNPPSVVRDFRALRLDEIVAYDLVIDSLCFERGARVMTARQVGTRRFRIDLQSADRTAKAAARATR